MGDPVTINLRHVARGLGIPLGQVQSVLELLDEGNTVPFITRYRKDQTGGLDEQQIRQIQARLNKLRLLAERKQTILRSIESQGKLTEKLSKQIRNANTAKRLEDLYLPYKPKKQTLATLARSRGLEPLAGEIVAAEKTCEDLDSRAADFVNPDREVPTAADALLGAGHIIAEQFSERAELRQRLREILGRSGKLVSTRIGGDPKPASESAGEAKPPEQAPAVAASGPPPSQPSQAADAPATGAPTKPAPAQGAPEATDPPPAAEAGPSPEKQSPEKQSPEKQSPEGQSTDPAGEPTSDPAGPPADANGSPSAGEPPRATDPEGDRTEHVEDPVEAERTNPPEAQGDRPAEAPAERPAHEAPSEAANSAEAEPVVADPNHTAPVQPEPQPASTEQAPSDSPGETGAQPGEAPPKPDQAGEAASEPGEAAAEAKAPKGADAKESAASAPTAKAPAPKRPKPTKADRKLSKKEQKKKRAEEKRQKAFRDYFDYSEDLKKIPPHRVLAINRGERAKILRVKIECDLEAMHRALDEICVPPEHPHAEFLRGCARDALARLILPSLEREARRELTERAELHAVGVFARNLRNLLLQPPVRGRRVLAVDPGYRSGCKLVALDQFGNVLAHEVIYLVGRPDRKEEAKRIVADLVERFGLTAVTIGNGTACRDTESFFAELIAEQYRDKDLAYVIVNEAGASVYSTSHLGREEFPDYDASLRGAISIGRRLQDPLSELVKIDPANIGVGLYQHDVKAKHLRTSLDEVVESCVNYVGVDVNTASPALLGYVSGLNQLTARRLCEHRQQHGPFRNREQLREVPGFGEATFVQAAGFLKIAGGDNPLDATWIHPESYEVAGRVMNHLNCRPADLDGKETARRVKAECAKIDRGALAGELQVGTLLLNDILAQLARPGRDPREDLPAPVFKQGVLKLEDLAPGMELRGTVLNVVDFGAFVDIGMHDSGLVHVSQLADRFVRDPHDVIAVGDVVRVWVLDVDKERRRVSLTMIEPGSRRPPRRREDKPARRSDAGAQRPKQGERTGRPDRGGRPGRSGKPPGPKGGPRDRGKGPHKPRHKPKSRPKPVKPITEEMKAGKTPMRSFSDLAQFFQADEPDSSKGARKSKSKSKSKPAKPKGHPPKDRAEKGAAPSGPEKPEGPPEPEETKPEAQAGPPEAQAPPSAPDQASPSEQASPQGAAGPPSDAPKPTEPAPPADAQAQAPATESQDPSPGQPDTEEKTNDPS